MQSSVSFPGGQSQPQLPQKQSRSWQTLGWKDSLPGNLRRKCAFQRCLPWYCSPPPLPTNLFVWEKWNSFGLQAVAREWSKTLCYKQEQVPEPPASLPKEPGVVTARARQHSQWSLRSHSRENNHPHPPLAHLWEGWGPSERWVVWALEILLACEFQERLRVSQIRCMRTRKPVWACPCVPARACLCTDAPSFLEKRFRAFSRFPGTHESHGKNHVQEKNIPSWWSRKNTELTTFISGATESRPSAHLTLTKP